MSKLPYRRSSIKDNAITSCAPYERLANSTVSGAVSYCATFREKNRLNPTKDEDLQSSFLLQRLYQAFKIKDPKEKQQKAVPPCVISKLTEVQITELQTSYTYKVPLTEKRRTDILRLRNIGLLHLAECVAVTFEMKKKDEKSHTVHHKATKPNSLL
jgi:hypothetical protein